MEGASFPTTTHAVSSLIFLGLEQQHSLWTCVFTSLTSQHQLFMSPLLDRIRGKCPPSLLFEGTAGGPKFDDEISHLLEPNGAYRVSCDLSYSYTHTLVSHHHHRLFLYYRNCSFEHWNGIILNTSQGESSKMNKETLVVFRTYGTLATAATVESASEKNPFGRRFLFFKNQAKYLFSPTIYS